MLISRERLYAFSSLVLLFLIAPVIGLFASPWIYRCLQPFAAEGSVLDAPFYRVASRVVLVAVALFFYPAYRLSGLGGRAGCGLPATPERTALIRRGFLLGFSGMLLIYLFGVVLDVFVWDTGNRTVPVLIRKSISALVGGFAVSVFEEILFRGFIFGVLRKASGLLSAVILGSLFFATVHLMRPVNPPVIDQWNSGFLLFGNLFARANGTLWQEAGTLFFMGVILSMLCYWTKSVYLAIGLHAGWVCVMMLFRLFMDNRETCVQLFGTTDWVSKAWIGVGFSLFFLLLTLLLHKKWKNLGPPASTF